jgi:hypothetical protein
MPTSGDLPRPVNPKKDDSTKVGSTYEIKSEDHSFEVLALKGVECAFLLHTRISLERNRSVSGNLPSNQEFHHPLG